MSQEMHKREVVRRERLRYGLGAFALAAIALALMLVFNGVAAQGPAAPAAPQQDIAFSVSSVTQIDDHDNHNAINQAVAGELVTVTVVYTIPEGMTVYDASPRVVLEEGLLPTGSAPEWSEMITGTTAELQDWEDKVPARFNGALVIFSDQGTLTGTDTITMVVYAVRTQYGYVSENPIGHSTNTRNDLDIQAILRYCEEEAECEDTVAQDETSQVRPVNPSLNVPFGTPVYRDAASIGEGGGQVQLTFNTLNAANRPTAYDVVYTATLDAALSYVAAPEGTHSVIADQDVIIWQLPDLAAGESWQGVVTATLPNTFTIGQEFEYAGAVAYETFPGPEPANQGQYTAANTQVLRPGLSVVTKASVPASGNVTMGDVVTYTVSFTQAANTLLAGPQVVDTQPLGFHYISDTFKVQGAVTTSFAIEEGPSVGRGDDERHHVNLTWSMDDSSTTSPQAITVTYEMRNTGLDHNGRLVLTSDRDMTSNRINTISRDTGAVLSWTPPTGSTFGEAPRANADTLNIFQPYMGEFFSTSRIDGESLTREVGQLVRFRTEFRNNGHATAYDVTLCDQLPEGLVLDTTSIGGINYSPGFPARSVEPQHGDNLLCWEMPEIPRTTTSHTVEYYVRVLNTVIPGIPLVNHTYLVDYSSQPGEVAGERHYSELAAGLPAPAHCADPDVGCLTVLGLTVDKTPWQTTAEAGDFVTYTLSYADTSGSFSYQNVVLTDTFDAGLATFISATTNPTQESAGQLVWNVGYLNNTGDLITVTMQVTETIPDGVIELPNVLSWSSEEIPLHTITRTIALQAANLNIAMSGPENVHAGEDIVYTVVYSNVGSATSSPVVLTLDYGQYVEFISSDPLQPLDEVGTVFTDTVPGRGENITLTIQARVKAPLPYTLEGPLAASATIESPGAEDKSAEISMVLDRPVFDLSKIGPPVAEAPGRSMEYTIHIANRGAYTATNVVLTDTWGNNLAYDNRNHEFYGWNEPAPGDSYAIRTFDLGVDEVKEFFFWVEITELASFYTNTVALSSDQTTTQTDTEYTWQVSIATSKSVTPTTAFPGRVLTYTIYYTNTNDPPGALSHILITDTLPSGFAYINYDQTNASGCSGDGWQFTAPEGDTGGDAVWYCENLQNDATGQFLIWGLVAEEAEGTKLINVTESSGSGIPTRPIEQPLETRVARPWLRVDKEVYPTHPVAPGDLITYTLVYTNYGTDPAYNVVIEDYLPDEVDFVTNSCLPDCSGSKNDVYWVIPVVPTDTVGSVQFAAQVKDGMIGEAVNANYTIQSDRLPVAETITGDPVTTTILAPELTLYKTATPPVVTEQNQPITYTIYYTNSGGGLLSQVVLTDVLSPDTAFDSASHNCERTGDGTAGGVVTCALGDLSQGEHGQVQIVVENLLRTGQGIEITNVAIGDADQIDPVESNQTSVFFGCIPPHNIAFTWSEDPTVGEPVTFIASADGDSDEDPFAYEWDFGDDTLGAGQEVSHTYTVSDTYEVHLMVTNVCGFDAISQEVSVTGEPGTPGLDWTPQELEAEAVEGSEITLERTLTVSNSGEADLIWTIEVSPTEVSWLHIAVAGGEQTVRLPGQVTAPDAATLVTAFFDPNGLSARIHEAQLRITSNAQEDPVYIDVTFNITAADPGEQYIYLPLVLRSSQ